MTDVALKAVAGAAYPLFHKDFTPTRGRHPATAWTATTSPSAPAFPYVALPWSGVASARTVPTPPTGGASPRRPSGQPGMPTTGQRWIAHLGDIYGLVLALVRRRSGPGPRRGLDGCAGGARVTADK